MNMPTPALGIVDSARYRRHLLESSASAAAVTAAARDNNIVTAKAVDNR